MMLHATTTRARYVPQEPTALIDRLHAARDELFGIYS
jgi:hypothetical protein